MHSLLNFFKTGEDRPAIGDRGEIDRLYRRHRLRVLVAITLGYGLVYTCRLALSVVKKPLIDEGIFTPVELGLIGAGLFYGYAAGKLVNGFLADHANMKVFFAFGVLLSAIANIGMGFSTALTLCIVLWAFNGWFQGFGAPAGIVTLANWFSNSERGRFYGIWSTAHSIGEGLTFVVVAALVANFGWRWGYWGPGVLCIVVAFALLRYMQDRPRTLGLPEVNDWHNDHWQKDGTKEKEKTSLLKVQFSILALPAIWILALASATNYVVRYAINSWGILYLQEARGYSLVEAGSLLMVNTIAGIAGCIAFGYLSDKVFNARRPPANLLFAILEIIALALIFFGPTEHADAVLRVHPLRHRPERPGHLAGRAVRRRHRAEARRRRNHGICRHFQLHRRRYPGKRQRLPHPERHDHGRRYAHLRFHGGNLVLARRFDTLDAARRNIVARQASGLTTGSGRTPEERSYR